MVADESRARRELVRAGREFYRQGMMAGAAGNLSARLDQERILITPSGAAKGRLRPSDLLIINLAGEVLEGCGRPSSETAMHLAIYRRFPEAGAVIHAHPPKSTALAAAHQPVLVEMLPEALFVLGSVPMVPYVPPASPELGEAVATALDQGDGALLLNHGAITIGTAVEAARRKMEVLEALAETAIQAHLLGGGVLLPPTEVERLRQIWRQRRWS